MGYRINLSNANSVGHLIEGNVVSFLNQTLIDENYLEGNLSYLDDIMSQENNDFVSSDTRRFKNEKSNLSNKWYQVRDNIKRLYFQKQESLINKEDISFENREEIYLFLSHLSKLLGSFQIKFLVLPGFENDDFNKSLIDRNELVSWLQSESNYSYLIIQLKEIPKKDDIQILNSFKHFDAALQRIDEWPGVLVWKKTNWNRTDGLFIPIKNIFELKHIIASQSFEKDYFNFLIRDYGQTRTIDNAQLIHLSDLHFGLKNETNKVTRLINILNKHRAQTNLNVELYPLISGDLVDSPSDDNLLKYYNFLMQLDLIGFEKPISVLGNHDSNVGGIIRTNKKIKNVISSLATSEHFKVIEELKLIIIKFNSNTDGHLAQGKIGVEQLAMVGNLLDGVPNLSSYCLIGMLHHHPFELSRPEWMRKTWYEAILGDFTINQSLKLLDSDLFIEWINKRKIKFLIHGHKHIPMLFNKENINVISAGSSTGNIKHIVSDKTFITYNVINYNKSLKKPISSMVVFEDLLGSGTSHYQIMKY